jgi:hypothetical protein
LPEVLQVIVHGLWQLIQRMASHVSPIHCLLKKLRDNILSCYRLQAFVEAVDRRRAGRGLPETPPREQSPR